MGPSSLSGSLQKRLTVAVSVLLLAVLAAFSLLAYRIVERALIRVAEVRLSSAAEQLASLLGDAVAQERLQMGALLERPAVDAFLRDQNPTTEEAAWAVLNAAVAAEPARIELTLRTASGTVLTTGDRPVLDAGAPAVDIAPFTLDEGRVTYMVSVERQGPGGSVTIGERLQVGERNGAVGQRLSELIGEGASFLMANESWDVWTGVGGPSDGAPPPNPTPNLARHEVSGAEVMGLQRPIGGTPWVVWLALPSSAVVDPLNAFLGSLGAAALILVLVGSVGAWIIGRHLTGPLVELTHAAESIASGDYSTRPQTKRTDEVGRLARAFDVMGSNVRDREERFRQVTETMNEVFLLVDVRFEVAFYISPGYEAVWGESRDAVYDSPRLFIDAVLPEDRAALLDGFERTRNGGAEERQEFRIRRPNGQIRWVVLNSRGVTNRAGHVYRIAGIARDITKRREAEEALQASEKRLRNLFENVNLIVLVVDADGNIEYVNPFLLELTGYAAAELIGGDVLERLRPDALHEDVAGPFRDLLENGRHAHFQAPIFAKDGKEVTVSWHNTVLRDTDQRPVGVVSIGEDITQRARLQEQLQRAQRMESVGRLAGGIAHDFNNLLTAILGPAELLLMDLEENDAKRDDLNEIRAAAERAAGLTRQLLAFSRQQVLEPRVLDLNSLVADLDRLLARVIGEDVERRTLPGSDLGTVRADPGQLEQVILNLAINSRDAMPGGGILTIETMNTELDSPYAAGHAPVTPGRYVMLAVSDTGTGMDEKTRAQIFEPFFTTKPKGKGTGLGLATVYGIVKQSGGYIWAYSEPGQGTTIKVYLPRIDEPVALVPMPVQSESLTGPETILVVEDEKIVQGATRKMLEARGYNVLVAERGREALEIARGYPGHIALLVTDVVMPEMGGRELSTRIAEIRPEIRVLFVSGYTDDMIVQHGVLDEGVNFLQKPFTFDALARKVRKVLDAQQVASP